MGSGYTCISCLRCVVCCIDDVEAFQSNCRKNNFHTWLQMPGHFPSVYYTTPSAQCAIFWGRQYHLDYRCEYFEVWVFEVSVFWGRQYHLDYRCESALVFSKLAPRISLFSIFCLIFLSHPLAFHIPLSFFSEIHIQYHHNIQNRAGKIVDLIFFGRLNNFRRKLQYANFKEGAFTPFTFSINVSAFHISIITKAC